MIMKIHIGNPFSFSSISVGVSEDVEDISSEDAGAEEIWFSETMTPSELVISDVAFEVTDPIFWEDALFDEDTGLDDELLSDSEETSGSSSENSGVGFTFNRGSDFPPNNFWTRVYAGFTVPISPFRSQFTSP